MKWPLCPEELINSEFEKSEKSRIIRKAERWVISKFLFPRKLAVRMHPEPPNIWYGPRFKNFLNRENKPRGC
jgi:hypothetical protein